MIAQIVPRVLLFLVLSLLFLLNDRPKFDSLIKEEFV